MEAQPEKAPAPMEVTEEGISTEKMSVRPDRSPSPSETTDMDSPVGVVAEDGTEMLDPAPEYPISEALFGDREVTSKDQSPSERASPTSATRMRTDAFPTNECPARPCTVAERAVDPSASMKVMLESPLREFIDVMVLVNSA